MKLKTCLSLGIGLAISSSTFAANDAFKSAGSVMLLDSTYVTVQPTGSATFNITRKLSIKTKEAALKIGRAHV